MKKYPNAKLRFLPPTPHPPSQDLDFSSKLAMDSLCKPYPIQITPAQSFVLQQANLYWVLSLHWLYKLKWNPQHKIPVHHNSSYQVFKTTKAFGELLFSIANLCEGLHSIGAPYSGDYGNAVQWFERVAGESKLDSLSPPANKTTHCKGIREEIAMFRDYKNPYNLDAVPHTWRFVESAISVCLSEAFPRIERELWIGKRRKGYPKGFIHAYSAWAAVLGKPGVGWLLVEDGKLRLHAGAGNRYQQIPLDKIY